MSERNVLAACLNSRQAYDKVVAHTEKGDFGEQGRIVLDGIGEYYSTDPVAECADPDIVARDIARAMPNPKHKAMFEGIVADLSVADVSPANVIRDLVAVRREAAAAKLATALTAGRSVTDVAPLLAEYSDLAQGLDFDEDEEDSVYNGTSVADLVRSTYTEEGLIKVWPKALNDRLDGGCLRGHHIVVFARPEAGKTLMVVNMIAGFLAQNLRVLYCGNEDPTQDIVLRVVSRLTGKTKYEVQDDPDTADYEAREKGYDNLILAGLSPGSPSEIEQLINDWSPDVVVIDQLRNINVGEEQFVQKLEKAATAARNLGKRHDVLMVSVTQAGDSASGKAVLDMGDVDSSNTGIPATADVMVGVGGTEEDFSRNRRVISLPKNKRSGVHDFFPVTIEPQLSKVRGIE